MADVMLMALTLLAIVLSAPALTDTRNILRLDVASGLMIGAWLLPQAYPLRNDPFAWYYDLSFTYGYVFVCIALLAVGSLIGRRMAERSFANQAMTGRIAPIAVYDPRKLAIAALVMTAIGGVAFGLMARAAQGFGVQDQWSGIITLYHLLSQFMVFGGTLGILVYMQYKDKWGLVAFFAMLLVAVPIVVIFVRRSVLFQIGAATLGAFMLNRDIRLPRLPVAIILAISILILNGAGPIRQHIFYEGGTIVSAFTEGVIFREAFTDEKFFFSAELKSAASDIEIARATNHYKPFVMLWNIAVSQYVPGFLIGDELKSSFLIPDDNQSVYQSYFAEGATRTGFAESFTGYSYFGPIIYLIIGVLFGRLWVLTTRKDIKAQQIYLVFLLYSLLTITESISRMVVTAPIIMASIWLSFKFAQLKPADQAHNGRIPQRG